MSRYDALRCIERITTRLRRSTKSGEKTRL